MNKNNKKTMNERTHNPFDTYKEAHNTNSNTNNPGENRTQEFTKDFDMEVRKERRDDKER